MRSKIHRWPTSIEDQATWQTREDGLDAEALREVSARRFARQTANQGLTPLELRQANLRAQRRREQRIDEHIWHLRDLEGAK